MEKKKIIFFDADGTIRNGKGVISKKTKEAFQRLQENGHIVVLSTGRPLPMIDGALGEMGFENIIASAGHCVVVKNQIVFSQTMSQDSQKYLFDYFDDYETLYQIESHDHIWVKTGEKENYANIFKQMLPVRSEVSEDVYQKVKAHVENIIHRVHETDTPLDIQTYKIMYYNPPIDKEKINEDLKDFLHVPLSVSKLFEGGEVSEKGITKSEGMDIVLQYFDIEKDDIYAIGDDYNDIEMLKSATHKIAMGHAPEELKYVANYITEDLENEGFYKAMKHFGLI